MKTGLLLVRPADEPDVDLRIAVQVHEMARVRFVAHVLRPGCLITCDCARELAQLEADEVPAGRDVLRQRGA